jgi:hypothetical protein
MAPELVGKINRKAKHSAARHGRCACGKRTPEPSLAAYSAVVVWKLADANA